VEIVFTLFTDFGLEPKSVICWERHFKLLKRTGVACVPGEAFYHDDAGENLARFCYAKEDTVLNEACRRIERLA